MADDRRVEKSFVSSNTALMFAEKPRIYAEKVEAFWDGQRWFTAASRFSSIFFVIYALI